MGLSFYDCAAGAVRLINIQGHHDALSTGALAACVKHHNVDSWENKGPSAVFGKAFKKEFLQGALEGAKLCNPVRFVLGEGNTFCALWRLNPLDIFVDEDDDEIDLRPERYAGVVNYVGVFAAWFGGCLPATIGGILGMAVGFFQRDDYGNRRWRAGFDDGSLVAHRIVKLLLVSAFSLVGYAVGAVSLLVQASLMGAIGGVRGLSAGISEASQAWQRSRTVSAGGPPSETLPLPAV